MPIDTPLVRRFKLGEACGSDSKHCSVRSCWPRLRSALLRQDASPPLALLTWCKEQNRLYLYRYSRAALCYEEAGRGQAAAEALSKGARSVEDTDAQVRPPGYRTRVQCGALRVCPMTCRLGMLAVLGSRVAHGIRCGVVALLQAASELYAKAVKSLEAEGKAGMSSDIFRCGAG